MKTRRNFLRNALLGLTSAPILPTWRQAASAGSAGAITGELPSLVPNPVARKHRNLFNGDTCVYFYNPEYWQPEDFTVKRVINPRTGKLNEKPTLEGGPFSARSIHRYVDVLADNGIDTFIINANASRAWYPSKTIPSILDGYKRGDRDFFRGHAIALGLKDPEAVETFLDGYVPFMNLYQDLLDAGVDWLAETTRACRRRQLSPWVSIRMNDMHGARNFEGSFFNAPMLTRKEMRLKNNWYGYHNSPTRQGLNYEKQEVRNFMFAQIREVVEDYDFEGLELDWWRLPLCCEPTASPQTVAMMTDWFRQIRALTEKQARKAGRPFPLGMRIPGRLDILKVIGLDVVTLCQEGTLDFISPSGFWCTTWDMPYDTLRKQVGDRVAIYGVIEDGVNTLATSNQESSYTQAMRYLSASPEIMRANAAGKLAMGADGIEWFNFFCTDQPRVPGQKADYSVIKDIHQLNSLRGYPKHYSFAIGGQLNNYLPYELPAQLPAILPNNSHHAFKLAMCAEPSQARPDQAGMELVIQIIVKADDDVTFLPVSFNGSWPETKRECVESLLFPCGPLTHFTSQHVGHNFRFPVSLVRDGWNEVLVENAGKNPVTVVCVELAIRPKAD
ncbi:hypothetical protein GCM10023189_21320 [Nibrella saemangeumensis]|uniref:Glycosyl hydrolase-like 10 domain-containing protein n=1 Tax=Nibrella saemangeumensis TaxID=1084526 RepID=A0ABP8MR96_9BACT